MKGDLKLFAAVIALQVCCFMAKQFSFEGYKVVELIPSDDSHYEMIKDLQNHPDFDVLSHNYGKNTEIPVLVMLSPEVYDKYSRIFAENNLSFSVADENFQQWIDVEKQTRQAWNTRTIRNIVGKFARYIEINNFIKTVANELNNPPSMDAHTYILGKTYEKRDISALVVKSSTATRGIFIECGIHAREWIAVSSCIFFIDQLKQGWMDKDPKWLRILNYYEIHIVPLFNPDGYEHSHEKFRMWRKNRNPNNGSNCVGTDLNRNFGYRWMVAGGSSNPCSATYAGPTADSELETKALINAINSKLGYWDAYLSVHAYGNFWISSWVSWDYQVGKTVLSKDLKDLIDKSKIAAKAMEKVANSEIITGNADLLFGQITGASDDWARGKARVKYTYTIELAPGENDPDFIFGFAISEDRAPIVGKELTEGIKAFLNSIF